MFTGTAYQECPDCKKTIHIGTGGTKNLDQHHGSSVLELGPSGPDESLTWTQPEGLSPSVTRSDWSWTIFEGIHVDFQAGELLSPATKLYIHF